MRDAFLPLPDESRLWVRALDRALDAEGRQRLEAGLTEVLGNWRHKGHVYEGAWEIFEDRLLVVVEPNMATNPSGCAIDGMLRKVDRLTQEAGAALMDEDQVIFRVGGQLRSMPKAEVGERLADGTLGPDTPVLDLALFNLGQLRQGQLEKALARTWIGRKYKIAVGA
ncbi:MAG: hypothetical protein HYZ13_12645 [Acidobacteria bacterium]|nr:hypothetical protein [Acidobacteriota bacterium]